MGVPSRVHDPSPPEGRHAADWLGDAVRDLGAGPSDVPPSMLATAEERLAAGPLLGRLGPGFLAVHPGSGSVAKNWDPDSFRSVVDRLSPGAPFLLARGPADAVACAELEKDPRAAAANELPLRVLGALLASAGVFIGNDSGVSHLAAAFGARTLALFGPTDARTWRPVGCCVRTLSSSSRTMAGLSVEDVVAAAQQLPAPRDSRGPKSAERALPSG
jgi:ADP-heptose:LPS heptosyltransferase